MAIPVDDLTAALPKPATAPPAPARVPDPLVTARVPVAVPPTAPVEPVTARVPVAVPPTAPVEPVTARVPVAVPPTAPVEPVTARVCSVAVPPAAPATPVPAAVPAPVPVAPVPVAAALAEVLAGVLDVKQVSVDAHFFDDLGADSMVMARFCARARKRDDLPSVSIKDVVPAPDADWPRSERSRPLRPSPALLPPHPPRHRPLRSPRRSRRCWRGCSDVKQVSVDAHFFDDLGADSMVMARFCARARKRDDLPSVSIKDVYRHPTADRLAAAFASVAPPAAAPVVAPSPARDAAAAPDRPAPVTVRVPAPEAEAPVGRPLYVLCGVLQFLIFVAYSSLASLVAVRGFDWVSEGLTWWDLYRRSVIVRLRELRRAVCAPDPGEVGADRPLAAHRQIRVWSLAYVRFWVGEDADPVQPAGAVPRVTALRALPAGSRREDRPGRGDLLPDRAGVHGPPHHRRRDGHPQGLVRLRLPRPRRRDPDRPDHPRQ